MENMVEFRNVNLSKTIFEKEKNTEPEKPVIRQILRNVSFSVEKGKIFAILGSSGSGKTTILRLINRLDDPTEGEIFIGRKNVKSEPVLDLRRKAGFVFQLPFMFEGKVIDNVLYGPRLSCKNEEESKKKVLDYLPWFGFKEEILEREPSKLSVGEKQRISILRTLMNEPEILLLDEPTSSLDPASARRVLSLIRDINHKTGMTIIVVTHIPDHARQIAERALVISSGEILAEDEIEKILKLTAEGEIAHFLNDSIEEEGGGQND